MADLISDVGPLTDQCNNRSVLFITNLVVESLSAVSRGKKLRAPSVVTQRVVCGGLISSYVSVIVAVDDQWCHFIVVDTIAAGVIRPISVLVADARVYGGHSLFH